MSYLDDIKAQGDRSRKRRAGTQRLLMNILQDEGPNLEAPTVSGLADEDIALEKNLGRINSQLRGGSPRPAPVAHSPGDGHAHGRSPAATAGSEAAFNAAVQKLIAASGGKVSVYSGKRSTEKQAKLWAAALRKYGNASAARKWVAPPGRSNHEKGLANDLRYTDDATRAWTHANAAKYGLNFPLANENWHIEPIGIRKKK